MHKPFAVLTILLLLVVAAAHALRIVLGWPVLVAGLAVSPALSGVAVVLCLGLAFGLWWETFRAHAPGTANATKRRTAPPKPTPKPAKPALETAPVPAPPFTPAPMPLREPARYFLFSSAGVTPQQIRVAKDRYARIMVGFDSGDIPQAALKAAREAAAELEIYVEGPGGPTGSHWADDERERIATAARSVGIDTSQDNWMRAWDREGWKIYTFRQLEQYRAEGYAAAEIDNLDRVLGDTPEPVITFFKEYAARHAEGRLPRLLTKNLSEEKLARLVRAIEAGELPRAMFSEFHISETGSGNRKKQDALSARIAIRTLASNDTHNYDAKGAYGLEDAFNALLGHDTPVPVADAHATSASAPSAMATAATATSATV